jgi:hypothetical protein
MRGERGEARRRGIVKVYTRERERERSGTEVTGRVSLCSAIGSWDKGKALRVKVKDGGSCT